MDLTKLVTQKDLVKGSGLTQRQVFYAIETDRITPVFNRRGSGNTSYFDPALITQLRMVKERLDWGLTLDAAWREEDPNIPLPDPPKFNYER